MNRLLLFLHLPALIFAQNSTTSQNATTFALVYGYPLLAWQRYASGVIEDVGLNAIRHARELSTPANRTVVKPNVDTLYSTLIYDLSNTNLAVNVPDIPADNYKLFSFYDPYGVNWANVGTGGEFFKNGSYLLQSSSTGGQGLQVTNGSDYVAQLNAPSPYGTLLVRWGVNQTNEDVVHQYQDATTVEEVTQSRNGSNLEMTPRLESLISAYNTSATPALNVLNLLARYEEGNTALTELQAAGISNGNYEPKASVNLTLANSTAIAQAAESATNPDSQVPLNQGWFVLSPNVIGTYGTDYALRTAIASTGYLALRNPFAVYPTWSNGSDANATASLELGSNEALLFTFSGKLPLQQAGFWSMTAYGGDYFLIPNDIETYALGDRSNMTYSDGSPIYGPDADENQDGTFQILMQAADVSPPSNWTSNWLPAPSGGGAVVAQLRFFAAEDAESNGDYEYPSVVRMGAVREGGGSGSGGNATSGGNGGGSSTSSSPSGTSGGGANSASASTSSNGGKMLSGATVWSWSAVLLLLVVTIVRSL